MQDYKEDIIATRKGCLGGSDAKLIQSIAELGNVPNSAIKRLAICKGLTEQPKFSNNAIEFGNYIEECVYSSLYANDTRWQSNPCLVSEKYSRKNVKVIDHVDLYLQDDENKVLTIGEVKATQSTYAQTYDEYKWQIMHHYLLGCEKAKELGGYKVKIMLCHYCTDGLDLTQGFEFDTSRLTVKTLRLMERISKAYHLMEGVNIINDYLDGMTEYYEEEISGDYLPEKVRNEFDTITTFLAEIKEREAKVDEFKKRLTTFMTEKGIKSIKNDAWAITLVAPSEAVSVDYKTLFVEEIEAKKPRVANKLKEKYKKTTKKSAFVKITLRNKDN